MRVLLSIFLLCVSIAGFSQDWPINAAFGTNKSRTQFRGVPFADSAFQFRYCYPDTATANAGTVDLLPGAFIRLCDGTFYVRNETANAWIQVGGGGETGNLQEVTDLGNYTTNKILSSTGFGTRDTLQYLDFWTTTSKYMGGVQDRQFTSNAPYTNDTSAQIGFTHYGPLAGYANRYQTTPTSITTVGSDACRDCLLSGNVAFGNAALKRADSAFRNAAGGNGTIQFTRYGDENTTWGTFALETQTGVSGNVAVGSNAARGNKQGTGITVVGSYALVSTTTGVDSVQMTNSGHGCSGTPTVTFSTPVTYNKDGSTINGTPGAAAVTATGTAVMDGSGNVIRVTMTNKGSAYSTQLAPGISNTVTFSGGGCAVTPTATVVLTSGDNNTAMGSNALRNNTYGDNNTAIGYGAGYASASDYASTIDEQAVFIGALASRSNSVPTTTKLTNIVALGYDAKVAASNSIVLGNSSMTTAYLYGVANGEVADSIITISNHQIRKVSFGDITPTFQEVLTAGSTMTTTNTVNGNGNEFIWEQLAGYQISTQGSAGSINLATSNSNLFVHSDSITFRPYLGKINIDSIRTAFDNSGVMMWNTNGGVGVASLGSGLSLSGGVLSVSGASVAWNSIANPTGDQALTFDAGESSTWTNSNTTEDLFTVNSSTMTTSSLFSLNSTSTALASGNNLMELIMSGANATNGITATPLVISVTNTNATSGTNIGIDVTASGATTDNIAIRATGGIRSSVGFFPTADDGATLGSTALKISDIFLASGAVINFNAGNYTLTHTAGNLTANGNMILSSGNFVASTGSVAANNQLLSNSTGSSANLAVMSSNGGSSSTNAPILLGGAASMGIRTVLNGSAPYAMTANQSYATFISGQHSVTEAASGVHALIAGVGIRATSVTGGVATVTNTATLYVEGASSATVTGNNYSIFADAGDVRFDGNFVMGGVNAGTSATNTFALFNGTIPSASVTDGVQMYSEDVAASAELKARDEAGNIATLTPHNFTGIPNGRSEDMAWAFYGERNGTYINVDMLKLARLVEKLTGEKLVYIGTTNDKPNPKNK